MYRVQRLGLFVFVCLLTGCEADADLMRDRFDQSRVGVPESVHGDARGQVQVASPFFVPNLAVFATHEHELGLAVVGIEVASSQVDEFGLRVAHVRNG